MSPPGTPLKTRTENPLLAGFIEEAAAEEDTEEDTEEAAAEEEAAAAEQNVVIVIAEAEDAAEEVDDAVKAEAVAAKKVADDNNEGADAEVNGGQMVPVGGVHRDRVRALLANLEELSAKVELSTEEKESAVKLVEELIQAIPFLCCLDKNLNGSNLA